MVLQPIVEPVVLAFEADQHARRLPVSGDENLLGFSQTQESRQIVFDFSQRRLAHPASRARQASPHFVARKAQLHEHGTGTISVHRLCGLILLHAVLCVRRDLDKADRSIQRVSS